MGRLSDRDRSMIRRLRNARVLEDADAHKLKSPDGVIVVPCSDGDQMPDVFEHQCALAREVGRPVRPHMLSLHGGAMLIAENCPLYREYRVDDLLLQHIREAEGTDLKGIGTVVLYIHAPCGAAGLAGLSLVEQVVLLIRAKERVKEIDTTNAVVCFVHVDYGDRQRTYFISRDRWLSYWAALGRRLWGSLFLTDPHPEAVRTRASDSSEEDLPGPICQDVELLNAPLSLGDTGPSPTQLALENARNK